MSVKNSTSYSGLRIQTLTPADRDAWIRLRCELWPDNSPPDLERDSDVFLSSLQNGKFYRNGMVATVLLAKLPTGAVVGSAEVDLRPYANGCSTTPVGYLEGWYVTPELRRKGVGRALVRAAEEWARALGCKEMASDTEFTNETSQLAHKPLSYRETDRLVHFRRDLTATD